VRKERGDDRRDVAHHDREIADVGRSLEHLMEDRRNQHRVERADQDLGERQPERRHR
jgi:hypothetical protein